MNASPSVYRAMVLVFLATVGVQAADLEWRSYTSEGGRFTAKFPGEVKVEDKTNAIHTHASPPGIDADFRVAYTDRESADANDEAAYRELDRVRTKTCEGQGIEPQGIRNFDFGGRPSCVFNFTKDVGDVKASYRMWFIMDGKRFYQVLYGYPTELAMQADGEFFYKSFRINAR